MYNFRNCNKFYVTICIYPLVDSRTDTGERTRSGGDGSFRTRKFKNVFAYIH